MPFAFNPSDRLIAQRWIRSTSSALVLTLAALPAAAQNPFWVDQYGTPDGEVASSLAPDGTGGVFVSYQAKLLPVPVSSARLSFRRSTARSAAS